MNKTILVMYSTHEPSEAHIERLHTLAPEYKIVVAHSEAEARAHASDAEIILGHRYLSQVVETANQLKWVQSTAGGIDHLPLLLLQEKNVLLSRAVTSSQAIAKHAFTLFSQLEQASDTSAKVAMILGLGAIGSEVAKIAKSHNLLVWGVRRQHSTTSERLCDRLFTDQTWKDALPQVDVCFVCLPLLKGNVHVLDKDLITTCSERTIIVNVGRSLTIDEDAIIEMLKEGKLAGYGTDVAGPQVISTQDAHPELNLVVTPHIAAHYPGRDRDLESFIEMQVSAYVKGLEVENKVIYDEY